MSKHSLLALMLLPIALMAKPSGPDVVQGDATFTHPTKHTMQIVTGDQTIINWDEFSIDPDETTRFVQPSHSSAVLNRVVAGNESHIMGSLLANGKVFLVNPNGILIGPDATIDTHGFIASTLDVLDSEFMQGKDLRFRGNSEGKVVNLGKIRAWDGDIALIGRFVENQGLLQAPKGMAALAVGKEVLLKPSGEERVFICALSQNSSKKGTGISSSGEIEALKVRLLADGNPYKLAINHEGKIDATKTEERHGEIYLVAENGTVEVSGEVCAVKGDIRILGETVILHENALVDASYNFGAGQVLIGGSFQGRDPNILNSQYTFIHPGATVKVNSYIEGDGGLAVIWSNGATHFHGLIETQGGQRGGNGGLVEVSGKRYLDIADGVAKRPAPAGTPGKLLLDPSDIKITNTSPSTGISFIGPMTFTPSAASSNLFVKDLITMLMSGPVEVTTNSAFGSPGDITIAADMDFTNGYSTSHEFILSSDRDLIIQSSVQNSGTGDITCNVGRDLRMDGSTTSESRLGTQLGNVTIKTGRHVLVMGDSSQAQIGYDNASMKSNIDMTVGGDLIVQALGQFALIGHTNTTDAAPIAFTGNVTINSVGGNLLMSASASDNKFAQIGIATHQEMSGGSGPVTITGDVSIRNVAGSVKITGGTGVTGTYSLIGHGGRGRSFTETYFGDVSLQSVGDITIVGGQDAKPEKFAGIGFGQEFATPSTHNITSNLVSVESAGNIFIGAGIGPNPGFIGAYTGDKTGTANCNIGTVRVVAGNNLLLQADANSSAASDAVIGIAGINGPAQADIDVTVGGSLLINGAAPLSGTSNAFIANGVGVGPNAGTVAITVQNGNANLTGGLATTPASSQAFIRSSGSLNIDIQRGDLNVTSQDIAFINASGIANIFAAGNINVLGDGGADPASITNTGLLTVEAGNNINFINNSLIQNGNGILTVIAGNNINMSAQSFISNTTGNPVNIVVDNNFPTAPGIGIGAFNMPMGALVLGNGPIRIYTARQELNDIQGSIGGATFTPGPLFTDQSPEKWLTYFSDSFFHSGSPFTIFYKDGVLSAQNIQRSQVVISEMLTDLHPYDEYLGWLLEFQTAYATLESTKMDEKVTSSFQVIPDQLYYLRMKKNFDHNPRISHFVTFPKTLSTGKE